MAAKTKKKEPKCILSIGYPLLEVIVHVDEQFLDKNKIKREVNQYQDYKPIFQLIADMKPKFQPGGQATNMARILQWILPTAKLSIHIGAVGKDEESKLLESLLLKEKVDFLYQELSGKTGQNLILITKKSRAMIVDPGVSQQLTPDFLDQTKVMEAYKKSSYIYLGVSLLNISFALVKGLSELCLKDKKDFIMQIDSIECCKKFSKELKTLLPFIKIIFGNEEQFIGFAQALKVSDISFRSVMINVNTAEKQFDENRLTVITRGELPVMIAKGADVIEYPVPVLSNDVIIDRNYAGPAFVGGFLAEYIQDKPLEICTRMGIGAAQIILRHIGCAYEAASQINQIRKKSI